MTVVSLRFSPPRAGWMAVRLAVDESVLKFDVSDVPNNVIEELFDAVAATAAGRGGTVWWHDEPAGYWLELATADDDRVRLRLWHREYEADRPGRELLDITGCRRELLLPLWRGLRQFASYSCEASDWTASFVEDFPLRILRLRDAIAPRVR
ncbi:MAG: hypothetical protein AMXMBFR59_33200 [Rhodanobacteraceae bacterium]